MDCPAAKSDNLGATKMTTKANVGPWQQGNNTGGYDNWGNNGPSSSPADREDNNDAVSNDRGNETSLFNNGGNADAGTSSVVLAATNAPTTTTTPPTTTPMPKTPLGRRPW